MHISKMYCKVVVVSNVKRRAQQRKTWLVATEVARWKPLANDAGYLVMFRVLGAENNAVQAGQRYPVMGRETFLH
jgi:hypothetical protein